MKRILEDPRDLQAVFKLVFLKHRGLTSTEPVAMTLSQSEICNHYWS